MDNDCCIQKAVNGYTVRVRDPKIAKANQKSDTRWKDPNMTLVFTDMKALSAWLDKNLDSYLGDDEYSKSFATAVAEKD